MSEIATSTTPNNGLDRPTRYALIALALLQALALYALARLSDTGVDLRWLYGGCAVAGLLPLLFYLGCNRLYDGRNLVAAALLGPLLFGLGWHLGWLYGPASAGSNPPDDFIFSFALSMGLAVFVLASYLRAWSAHGRPVFRYPELLLYTHEQLFVMVLVVVFSGIAWALLVLWAALFDAIGIRLFSWLFQQPLFLWLGHGLIAGIALAVIRSQPRLIDTLSGMTRALLRVLLVPVAAAILLFVLALPWVGLQPIWATGQAASLMMALSLVLLGLFAVAFLPEPKDSGYPRPLRALIWLTVVLLPINVALAGWALGLRIDQHGLSVDRLWAGISLLLIAAYALGYAVVILCSPAKASARLQRLNVVLGLVVAGTLILVNTPMGDLRALSAHDQARRLLESRTAPERFDYSYLRHELGPYGMAELKRLRDSDFAAEHPLAAQRIAGVLKNPTAADPGPALDAHDPEAVAAAFDIVPNDVRVPAQVVKLAVQARPRCLRSPEHCRLVRAAHPEMTFWWVISRSGGNNRYGNAFAEVDGRWQRIGSVVSRGCRDEGASQDNDPTAPHALSGPFVAFSDEQCVYVIDPSANFLTQIVALR